MQNLLSRLQENNALIKPATDKEIEDTENTLDLIFCNEYKTYLSKIGVISYDIYEVYGLGISRESYLSLWTALPDFRQQNKDFDKDYIPLCDIGDGHYYIYDNKANNILLWASPNGGIVKTINQPLEKFLIDLLFDK